MSAETYSPESYEAILEALAPHARRGDFTTPPETGVLLRHDVDYCLSTAAKLAEINHAHAVSATFFVLVSSPLYNIFSAPDRSALRQIVDNGQNIGLHYHHTGGPLDAARLEREFAALELVAPEAQRVVAWHNPEGDLSELNDLAGKAGFVSAYDNRFFGPDRYVSDSNMQRSPDEIVRTIRRVEGQPLQVLLHPMIWISGQAKMLPALRSMFELKNRETDAAFMGNSVWAGQASENGGR